MTRFKKTNRREYVAPSGPRSRRYMRITLWMQDHHLISAKTPDSVVVSCPECKELIFGRDWDIHGKTCRGC